MIDQFHIQSSNIVTVVHNIFYFIMLLPMLPTHTLFLIGEVSTYNFMDLAYYKSGQHGRVRKPHGQIKLCQETKCL